MTQQQSHEEIVESLKKRRSDAIRRATDFMMTFVVQPDHVAVILATARMDDLLADLIRFRLLPCATSKDDFLDGGNGVNSFSNRIDLAFRIGVIEPQLASVLHLFRKIRNNFAQSYTEQSLTKSPHSDRLAELELRARQHPRFDIMKSRLEPLESCSESMKTYAICAVFAIGNLESAPIVTKTVDTQFTYLISYPSENKPH